ncbi:hypothetical protein ACM66B_007062 [Microbotryomycetes sp. NB124-2]
MSSWSSSSGVVDHRKSSKTGFGATLIHQLPTEILAHVFAHLPPSSLATAQRVCRDWHQVIADEASWRNAFETYYGIHKRDANVSLGRRIDVASWRGEYVSRVAVLQRWNKSRTPSLTYNTNVGPLAVMHVALPVVALPSLSSKPSASSKANVTPSLLAVSLQSGAASVSTPFTGKTAKGLMQATPSDNFGRALNLPHVPASSVATFPDGSKIIWGMSDGSLRFSTWSGSASGRGWAGGTVDRNNVQAIQGHRQGTQVTAVSFSDVDARSRTDCFATTGQDGMVHVWLLSSSTATRDRPAPARKAWSARIEGRVATGDALPNGCCLAFDSGWQAGRHNSRAATLVVGLEDGSVRVFTDIKLDDGADDGHSGGVLTVLGDGRERVQTLRLDVAQGLHLLVHRRNEPSFERLDIVDNAVALTTVFGHRADHLGALTAFATDFCRVSVSSAPATPAYEGRVVSVTVNGTTTPLTETLPESSSFDTIATIAHGCNFGERPFVVAGDAHGRTFIWDWLENSDDGGVVAPRRMIQGFESRVTALAITEAVVFVGGLDGTVRCFDILTSTLLRTFKDRTAPRLPSRMLAQGLIDGQDEDRWKVSHIQASRDAMVAAVGGRIISWKIGTDPKRKKHPAVGSRLSARSERYRSDVELRRQVQESLETLSAVQRDHLDRLGQEQRVAIEYGLPPSLDNMTEDEAVALAMMLSVEDEEARWFSDSLNVSNTASPSFGPVPGDLLNMEGLGLDDDGLYETGARSFGNQSPVWDDEDVGDEPDVRTSSLSVPTSPTLRGASLGNGSPSSAGRSISYSWRPSSSHSSPLFSAGPPRPLSSSLSSFGASTKIQVSPRLGPTYGSQVAAGPVPDMSRDLWPTAAAASVSPPASTSSSPAPLQASPSSTLPSPAVKRGWSDVARASPSPSATPARPTSMLSAQLSRNSNAKATSSSSVDEWRRAERESIQDELQRREAEELRFAIELSRAEAQSRQQV